MGKMSVYSKALTLNPFTYLILNGFIFFIHMSVEQKQNFRCPNINEKNMMKNIMLCMLFKKMRYILTIHFIRNPCIPAHSCRYLFSQTYVSKAVLSTGRCHAYTGRKLQLIFTPNFRMKQKSDLCDLVTVRMT